jgi:hypothetical protein
VKRLGKRQIINILASARPDQITYLDAMGDNIPAVVDEAKRHVAHWVHTVTDFADALGEEKLPFLRLCERKGKEMQDNARSSKTGSLQGT